MQQLVPQNTGEGNDAKQVDVSHIDYASCRIPRNMPFAVTDGKTGLMGKLVNAFFNWLRNQCA